MKISKLISFLLGGTFFISSSLFAESSLSNTLIAIGHAYNIGYFLNISSDNGKSWKYLTSPTKNILSKSSCIGNTCVMATETMRTNNSPLGLLVSQDNGQHWEPKDINGMPEHADFQSSALSCFGTEEEQRCIMAGRYHEMDYIKYHGFLTVSENHMNSWKLKQVSGLPADALYYAPNNQMSCTGNGSKAICAISVTVVNKNSEHNEYIITSQNGGDTWQAIKMNARSVEDISCTGNSPNTLCVALSDDYFFVSTDDAKTWTRKDSPVHSDDQKYVFFKGISCTGEGVNAVCASLGEYDIRSEVTQDGISTYPLLMVSHDAGNTWEVKSVPKAEMSDLGKINCTGSGLTATCIAAGALVLHQETNSSVPRTKPLLLISHDGGNSWINKTIIGASALGTLSYSKAAKCINNSQGTTCMVGGDQLPQTNIKSTYFQPLLVVTTDNANTWHRVTAQGEPSIIGGVIEE